MEFTDEHGKRAKRRILPDGFFDVLNFNPIDGKWYHNRMLLELDRATEDNPRFPREKVNPGIAYLRSRAYKQRFGDNSGRWLVVTTGERRMRNMKRQTEATAGRDVGVFYFTVNRYLHPETLLTEPVWMRGGEEQPCALFETT